MKSLVVLGSLGSGKTTTLIRLLAEMDQMDDVHLIINEVGRFAIDIDRINDATGSQLDVEGLTAGCLGCANLAEFDAIVERLSSQDGLLLVEPTGVADGHEIQSALVRHDVGWRCLTLVNPVTFAHDLRAGILSTQLEVATRIAITRPGSMTDDQRSQLLRALAPYGVPVVDLPMDKLNVTVTGMLADNDHVGAHDHSHCDHDHGHDHHHHDGHGYTTIPVMLRPEVTADELSEVCEKLDLRRAKGVVEGRWFDRVGSEFTLGEYRNEEPYAILITDTPLDEGLVARIAKPSQVDTRSLKQRLSGLSADEAHEEIDRLLAFASGVFDETGALRLSDESIDLACEIAKAPSVAVAYRQKAKQARIRHTLEVYDLLDKTTVDAVVLVEIGAILSWQATKRADEIGDELVAEIRNRTPATMWLEGLKQITDPRYDLVPAGYGGPLSPVAAADIARWGILHEHIMPGDVNDVFERMVEISSPYPDWSVQWRTAASTFRR